MKINVGYSVKSIDKALKQIEEYCKGLKTITKTFFQRCADKIVQLANERLNTIGLDYGIVAEIKNGWQPIRKEGESYILENTADRSVYIEFGVGQVAESDPHPEAGKDGYLYNKPSKYKKFDFGEGKTVWWFKAPKSGIDIVDDDRYRLDSMRTSKGIIIKTAGQPAYMYAFNAVQDFIDQELYVDIAKQLLKGL